MGVHSGKFAIVDGVDTVRNWSINEVNAAQRYVASNTLFGSDRKEGIRDWTGAYAAYGAIPLNMPGESFTFTGFTAPTDDVSGDGQKFSGTAVVESVVINWDWSSGALLNHVVNFGGHLALTKSTASQAADATTPNPPVVCGTKIEFGVDVDVTPTEWLNLLSATLTVTSELKTYINSSTLVSSICWTGRKSGPIDWNMSVVVQDDERGSVPDIPEIGQTLQFRIYDDLSSYWDLWAGHVEGYTGLVANRETGDIIQQTVPITMAGFTAGTAVGKIQLPGAGVAFWPAP